MILGASTSELFRVITGQAADIRPFVWYIQIDASTPPVVQLADSDYPAAITTATTTTILAGATSKKTRIIGASLYNAHSTQACDVTPLVTDGTNIAQASKVTLLPGETLIYTGSTWQHLDANGALYGTSVAQQATGLMLNPGFSTANLTSTKTITSGSCFAVYVGRLTKSIASAVVRGRVTTAMATITWGEVALAKGAINPGGNPTLTVVGFADVSATYNSTGQKSTTVNVSSGQSLNAGDDLWVIVGNSATTAAQMRAASIADDIQVGQQASVASRPSTIVGTPTAFTIEGATTLAAWVAALV